MQKTTLAHTYSIVAYDPQGEQLGVAVQSRYFTVGPFVPWLEPGVGAVATQSFVEVSYGPLGLGLMRGGKTAPQALQSLLASDEQREVRQVALVDAQGNVAVHTGANCIAEAGHHQGEHFSTQANLMARSTVWGAMAEAYEGTKGDLAERMMAALEAAEAEGGDVRGRMSAALAVVSSRPVQPLWQTDNYVINFPLSLRVEHSPTPIKELRRLLAIAKAQARLNALETRLSDRELTPEELELALRDFEETLAAFPPEHNVAEEIFWIAMSLTNADRLEAALPLFQRAFALNPIWRDLVPRMVAAGRLPQEETVIQRILAPPTY